MLPWSHSSLLSAQALLPWVQQKDTLRAHLSPTLCLCFCVGGDDKRLGTVILSKFLSRSDLSGLHRPLLDLYVPVYSAGLLECLHLETALESTR